jgi:hypothetical protein
LAIRNCRQEKIPDGHPKGKDDLSYLGVLVGSFLSAGRQEYMS